MTDKYPVSRQVTRFEARKGIRVVTHANPLVKPSKSDDPKYRKN